MRWRRWGANVDGDRKANDMNKHIERIQHVVAEHYGFTRDDLISRARHKLLSHARLVAIYVCREVAKASYPELGCEFGNRDHTTIIGACNRVRWLLARELPHGGQLRSDLQIIESLLAEATPHRVEGPGLCKAGAEKWRACCA